MREADGCESFDLYQEQGNKQCAFTFVQHRASPEAHDAAFGERIIQSGHLDKVLATLGQPLVQRTYSLVYRVAQGDGITVDRLIVGDRAQEVLTASSWALVCLGQSPLSSLS